MDKDKKLIILLLFCIASTYLCAYIINLLKNELGSFLSMLLFVIVLMITAVLTFIVSSNSINKHEKRTRK
ncbi:MAG: hypothetical protein RIR01_2305 [Bacteroidota bacterium]|jgi:uncharacterized membrane protein (DUF106 family)